MELDYTLDYLQLMQIRFEGRLYYDIDVPADMRGHIVIPALTMQPIVENCLKHGLHISPPWRIEIKGQMKGPRWSLEIRDNGIGFSRDIIQMFNNPVAIPVNTKGFKRDPSRGMGIENIIERFRLLYGNEAVFAISNNLEGGASVTIGGSVEPDVNLKEVRYTDGIS